MSQKPLFDTELLPTTTVHQSRMQIFQPTRRPKNLTRHIVTPWGEGRVHGKIGQAHADVLEAIFARAERWREIEDPDAPPGGPSRGIEILVDPHKIRMTAGGGKQMSWEQLETLRVELMQVVIDLAGNRQFRPVSGHIVEEICRSNVSASSRPGSLTSSRAGDTRVLWFVRVGGAFARFLSDDIRRDYDPLPIASLTAGVSQAVVRHILTHKNEPNGGWKVDEAIRAVGAGGTSQAMRDRRRELHKDAGGFAKLGLNIAADRISWVRKSLPGRSSPGDSGRAPQGIQIS